MKSDINVDDISFWRFIMGRSKCQKVDRKSKVRRFYSKELLNTSRIEFTRLKCLIHMEMDGVVHTLIHCYHVQTRGLTVTSTDNESYEANYNFSVEIGIAATTWTSGSSVGIRSHMDSAKYSRRSCCRCNPSTNHGKRYLTV